MIIRLFAPHPFTANEGYKKSLCGHEIPPCGRDDKVLKVIEEAGPGSLNFVKKIEFCSARPRFHVSSSPLSSRSREAGEGYDAG